MKPNILSFRDRLLNQTLKYLDKVNHSKILHQNTIDWTVAAAVPTIKFDEDKVKKLQEIFLTMITGNIFHNHPEFLKDTKQEIFSYFARSGIDIKNKEAILTPSVFVLIGQIMSSDKIMGKTVLIPIPTFGYYVELCKKNKLPYEIIEAKEENGWKITAEDLDKVLSQNPNIKLFIFNNPVNPTGVVYEKDELEKLADIFAKYDILIISDEIFKDVVFNDKVKFHSIGAIDKISNKVITLNGLGKSRGLENIRSSFGIIPENSNKSFLYDICQPISELYQIIMAEAIKDSDSNREHLRNNIKLCNNKIDFITKLSEKANKELNKHFKTESVKYIKLANPTPNATTVCLLDFSELKNSIYQGKVITTSLDLAEFLLDQAKVGLVPGEGFFIDGEKMLLRIGMMHPDEELEKGFEQITNAIYNLKILPKSVKIGGNGNFISRFE